MLIKQKKLTNMKTREECKTTQDWIEHLEGVIREQKVEELQKQREERLRVIMKEPKVEIRKERWDM